MKLYVAFVVMCFSVMLPRSQAAGDDEAVRLLPQAFCDAWNKHDGHALVQLMSVDVDFVTVSTTWFHGRIDFEKFTAGC
jgi:uncharacterized protein (TIGR02246 family)